MDKKEQILLLGLLLTAGGLRYYRNYIQGVVNDASTNENVSAFLQAIRFGEGTSGPNGYYTLYGGGTFTDDSDHPGNLGWPGLALTAAQCQGAGLTPPCYSTAAGAYQITKTTWNYLQLKLGLPDFSPASQDLAAIELIRSNGALDFVTAGDITDAINALNKVWASMPGSPYGQPTAALSNWQNAYTSAGGVITPSTSA